MTRITRDIEQTVTWAGAQQTALVYHVLYVCDGCQREVLVTDNGFLKTGIGWFKGSRVTTDPYATAHGDFETFHACSPTCLREYATRLEEVAR